MRSFRSLFGIGLLVALGYASFKLLPVYMSAYEFEDAVKEEARVSVYTSRSEDQIHDTIMKRAAELQIPLQSEQVIIRRTGDDLNISADYVVHVDLPSFPLSLKFHPSSSGHRLRGV